MSSFRHILNLILAGGALIFLSACQESADVRQQTASKQSESQGLWLLTKVDGESVNSDVDPVLVKVLGASETLAGLRSDSCERALMAEAVDSKFLHLVENGQTGCFIDYIEESFHNEVQSILVEGVDFEVVSEEGESLFQKRLELSFDSRVYVFHPVSE